MDIDHKIHISMVGIIGAGKTTFSEKFSKFNNFVLVKESIENEYLEKFYEDQKEYSIALQFHLLYERYKRQQQIGWDDKNTIDDRSIYEDEIFVKILQKIGCINELESKSYLKIRSVMMKNSIKPDILIFLDVSPEESFERIQKRGRVMEKNINLDYLKLLYDEYNEFISKISTSIPVIKIKWDEFLDIQDISESIFEKYNEIKKEKKIYNLC